MPLCLLLGAAGNPWPSLGLHNLGLCLCLHMALFSLCSVSSPFLSPIRKFTIGFRAHPNLGGSHLEVFTLITPMINLIPNKVTFGDSWWTYLLGGTIQPLHVSPHSLATLAKPAPTKSVVSVYILFSMNHCLDL